jgi:hypothetical protein
VKFGLIKYLEVILFEMKQYRVKFCLPHLELFWQFPLYTVDAYLTVLPSDIPHGVPVSAELNV